ncbi:phosphoribosyltransferase family protein [Marinoscillum sp. 108]|jgi:pyrimidine operon attenuation protein/uracil phosphoribosyltransferase|uniref:phosphoribosyltransferase family protein n=1 Tax=Marinoscillum sp. 108 TaxID=2653151 RepID=UPI0012F41467|nr:phosphoribosyltransferase family protein [Marinoscillum sp. 108]VXD17170.1 Phosphoribosyltransferase [Marinoscillum sp. 108]
MIAAQNLILSEVQVNQIIRRIAFEIYENNFDEKNIVVVGIYDKGYLLAERIVRELSAIAEGVKISLIKLEINKEKPLASEVTLDVPSKNLKGKVIILVDDVLNTGKTMAHSMSALLEVEVKKLQIAVLVNRSHKQFPLSANYKGYELSTTIDEHVDVKLEDPVGVFLY